MTTTHEITWIARKDPPKGANRRGCGIGYWTNKAGQRRYVRYTDSVTVSACRRETAISQLAYMADMQDGTGHTGAATLAARLARV